MCHTQFHSNLLFGLICIKLIMLRLCLHIFICDRDRSYWIFLTFDASQEFSTWNSCVIFFMSILKIRYFRSWNIPFLFISTSTNRGHPLQPYENWEYLSSILVAFSWLPQPNCYQFCQISSKNHALLFFFLN